MESKVTLIDTSACGVTTTSVESRYVSVCGINYSRHTGGST